MNELSKLIAKFSEKLQIDRTELGFGIIRALKSICEET